MQIKELFLQNIKNHKELRVKFSDGITAIIGKNGKGKTAILESIGFVLFDYLPYKQKEFITHGKTWGEIKLTIELSEPIGSITINRRIGNNPSYSLNFPDGRLVGKEDVQEYIKKNMNIDMELEKLYSEIVAIPQGLATAHFLLPKTQRAQIFDSIMGVDIYRKCWSKLVPVERILKEKIDDLENDIAILKHDTKDYDEQITEFENLNTEIDTLEKMIPVTQLSIDGYKKEFDNLNKMSVLLTEKEWIKEQLSIYKEELNEKKEELKDIDFNIADLEKISKQLEELSTISEKYNKINSELQNIIYGIKGYKDNIQHFKIEISEFNECMKEYPSLKKLADRLEEARLYKNGMIENIAVWESHLENLLELADGICPVTNDKCDKVSCERVEELKKSYESSLETSRKNLEDWTKIYNESYRAKEIVDRLDERKIQIDNMKLSLIDYESTVVESTKKKQSLELELKKFSRDLEKLENLRQLYYKMEGKQKSIKMLKEYINEIQDKIKCFDDEINDINSKTVDFDDDRFVLVREELERNRESLYRLEEECSQIKLQRDSMEDDIIILKEQLSKLKKYNKILDSNNKTLDKTKKIRDIFSKVGSKLTNSYLRNISYTANQIYQELMDTTESLVWESDYEVKVGNKKFNQLSGGQQVAGAISIRLALLKYFSSINLIVLDEIASNLDNESKENLMDSIRKLGNNNQILFVSHDEMFQNIGDNTINLGI